jgi:AGZA family xanthine/uracil permease-like MFS transporter
VVVGLFPGLAAWTMLIVKATLSAAGMGQPGGPVLGEPLVRAAHAAGAFIGGGFALEQGFLYSAMIWAAMTVCIVERQWLRAAAWSGVGAVLSLASLMHAYTLTGRDAVISFPLMDWLGGTWKAGQNAFPAAGPALGYALAAVLFLLVRFWAVPRAQDELG